MVNVLARNNRFIEYSLYIGCLLSNISQLPIFVGLGITQKLSFPGWILVLTALVLSRRMVINRQVMAQIGLGALFFIWILIDSLLIQKMQTSSSMFYSYMISLFIFLLGSWASEYVDARVLRNICNIFVASMLLVSSDIFIEYFGVGYNLATRQYAYSSKNSVSQIIFTVIVLLATQYKTNRGIGRLIQICAVAFEVYLLLLLRSRATIIGLILCVLVMAFSRNTDKKLRASITFIGISVITLLFINPQFNNFIFNNVLFAGRDSSDLNELTSGRIDILASFPERISGNWLTGIGPEYYECFPLSAILQFGLIGGVIAILISLQPLIKGYKMKNTSNLGYLLFLIAIGYTLNGLFEGLAPFGPGVKCYFMWLLFGILLGRRLET